jgi:hypothetical protein
MLQFKLICDDFYHNFFSLSRREQFFWFIKSIENRKPQCCKYQVRNFNPLPSHPHNPVLVNALEFFVFMIKIFKITFIPARVKRSWKFFQCFQIGKMNQFRSFKKFLDFFCLLFKIITVIRARWCFLLFCVSKSH